MPPAMKGKVFKASAGKPATETLRARDFTTGTSYPLGATVAAAGANFSLFSRSATGVELLLFDRADEFSPQTYHRIGPTHSTDLPLLARLRPRCECRAALWLSCVRTV
jgi:pullulanase/glycogen debranching enzyme